MDIAIIGGGGSGLVTAHLLKDAHAVRVFEAAPQLGGHVRTLGRNVAAPGLPPGVVTENGVLGFHRQAYPAWHALVAELGVELLDYRLHTGLFLDDGRCWVTPSALLTARHGRVRAAVESLRSLRVGKGVLARLAPGLLFPPARLKGRSVDELMGQGALWERWFRAGFVQVFSTPWEAVGQLPAELALAYFADTAAPEWSGVRGGVFRYLERIVAGLDADRLHVATPVRAVERVAEGGVRVHLAEGSAATFDKVVFATSPGQILRLLADPSDAERARLAPWTDGPFTTTAHRDDTLYRGARVQVASPSDFFACEGGARFAYNTSLTAAYGVEPGSAPIAFAHGLDHCIAADRVLERHTHQTPRYTPAAWATRDAIQASNGARDTLYAGAWLGCGLHEGCVTSALAVSRLLGGRTLRGVA